MSGSIDPAGGGTGSVVCRAAATDPSPRMIIRRSRYLDAFIGSDCGAPLLMYRMFPNAKEITESWAMFAATRHLGDPFRWDNPEVRVVSVADGTTPRTAAMFAFRTRWEAHSIDPLLEPKPYAIDRLVQHRARVEDVRLGDDLQNEDRQCDDRQSDYRPLVIVACHSHAPLDLALRSLRGAPRAVIAMPCCFPQTIPVRSEPASHTKSQRSGSSQDAEELLSDVDRLADGVPPDHEYDDPYVWSPRNRIKIWRDVR